MDKKLRKIWSVSLLILSCASLVVAISNIASFELPDVVKWIILAIDVVDIPVMVYSSVRLKMWKKSADGSANLEK
ncbi:hypothetical protein [Ruminococcus albus]|uniref:Lipoprotein n=1 Tax=Ruminococcus albus TaxID=1264 RepID=A0A1H7K3C1_RUMAL|nr:hypothetical protein [Ruminococcus albus]SEK80385.1 hypothetical protein SAMN05216469_1066 [Ruminococcus albus]